MDLLLNHVGALRLHIISQDGGILVPSQLVDFWESPLVWGFLILLGLTPFTAALR